MASKSKKTGRPTGAKTQDRVTASSHATACPSCDSSRRAPYGSQKRTVLAVNGDDDSGQRYNLVLIRPTSCLDCRQARNDRHTFFVPDLQKRLASGQSVYQIVDSMVAEPAEAA